MSRPPFTDVSGLARLRDAVLAPPALAVAGGFDGAAPRGPFAGTGRHRAESSPHTLLSVAANAAGNVLGLPGQASAPAELDDPEARRLTALVNRAKDGDTEAFARLYDHYVDTIYRYVYYRVGSKQLAEDLTSETFLRALRRIETFTWQGRDFGAWLVTISRNLVADHFKSSRFRLEVTTADMVDSDHVEESPEGEVMATFTNTALLEALQRLNAQQQECLVLRFLQGLSVAETAKVMGKNEGAIKTLQYRAIRALAALLPEEIR
ncbi:ECF subfamily RNA polymerase sigma factor, BldN family [Sporichthya polymorpha]|uniref:ECF subfamily RNA polymerase sigma factor, BldN family n=1 Tax=Sporichthya polymorpha TaxID=35751 RepID=UPI000373CCE6|nr:ECF subfamily RNA polymerase sigma factor, BldN family [Sporichthya polymorpha]